ncbi:MAG TPA: hypothetical protein VFQ30_10770, partial [Ktedonobacteraceae bacterium]|nr:hypothetical protein [Ktedonobacteraceae bacterium]
MKNTADHHFKIAFLTSESARDAHGHSGSLYYMGKALEQFCGEVTYIEHVVSWQRRIVGRIMREAARRGIKWHIAYKRLPLVARAQARLAAQHIARQHFDLIVAPDCVSEIAFLQTNIPILL